jgi:hypothetical protein
VFSIVFIVNTIFELIRSNAWNTTKLKNQNNVMPIPAAHSNKSNLPQLSQQYPMLANMLFIKEDGNTKYH